MGKFVWWEEGWKGWLGWIDIPDDILIDGVISLQFCVIRDCRVEIRELDSSIMVLTS